MLAGKKVLIGITGSIAAYKIIYLVRLLRKSGVEVKIVMTEAASDFVSPLVLETLSGNKVLDSLTDASTWANHVMLGRWADLILVAPASCNTIAKMANGICDNLLQAIYLSATCPVWIAPAMDEDMWLHQATKNNIAKLVSYGNRILDVKEGELASGLFGPGRLMEPEDIVTEIEVFFREKMFTGIKVLITAGPTYENIDPVRFVGNHSSGKMGFALAEAFYLNGADVVLITGPVHLHTKYPAIKRIDVASTNEMYEAVQVHFKNCQIAVLAAAVADFYIPNKSEIKIKKRPEQKGLDLHLEETNDILKSLGQTKSEDQLVVGFALETNNELENAKKKLNSKNADMIVLNSLQDENVGFGKDTNKVTFLLKDGSIIENPALSKKEVADRIAMQIAQIGGLPTNEIS
ncbi:MAG: bifunctional phosphopantothenoylcysteine decarboxylase/phosphopantothenate--cysteine ligase CoaBC [Pseudopedobacter saltans]|uniref:Coenzyme A biosynthesis bifunctional protein CoaBC n=1 Tax=Pseudopedobacter saltans TaxID=151895 RepID=A0A2W5H0H2_9SPHI|nr:MAG: bifunctional phosphopantothenoylcysteine decarboxylase/phosphopantothenate--cysteine ligase CoaBC [Pseudopedobacter saltans]